MKDPRPAKLYFEATEKALSCIQGLDRDGFVESW